MYRFHLQSIQEGSEVFVHVCPKYDCRFGIGVEMRYPMKKEEQNTAKEYPPWRSPAIQPMCSSGIPNFCLHISRNRLFWTFCKTTLALPGIKGAIAESAILSATT